MATVFNWTGDNPLAANTQPDFTGAIVLEPGPDFDSPKPAPQTNTIETLRAAIEAASKATAEATKNPDDPFAAAAEKNAKEVMFDIAGDLTLSPERLAAAQKDQAIVDAQRENEQIIAKGTELPIVQKPGYDFDKKQEEVTTRDLLSRSTDPKAETITLPSLPTDPQVEVINLNNTQPAQRPPFGFEAQPNPPSVVPQPEGPNPLEFKPQANPGIPGSPDYNPATVPPASTIPEPEPAKLPPLGFELNPPGSRVPGSPNYVPQAPNEPVVPPPPASIALPEEIPPMIRRPVGTEPPETLPPKPKPEPAATPELDSIAAKRDLVGRKDGYSPQAEEIQENLVKSGVAVKVKPEDYKNLPKGEDGIVRVGDKVALNEEDMGHYGKQTEAAVGEFQDKTGILKPDGNVGRATAVALKVAGEHADVEGKPLVGEGGEVNPETQGKVVQAVASDLMGDGKLTKLEVASVTPEAAAGMKAALAAGVKPETVSAGRGD